MKGSGMLSFAFVLLGPKNPLNFVFILPVLLGTIPRSHSSSCLERAIHYLSDKLYVIVVAAAKLLKCK